MSTPPEAMKIKVVGVGGAGSNVLDRLVLDAAVQVDLVACNTDVQSLASSVAAQKVQLGRSVTRGLGAGGDPEVGFNAAEESLHDLAAALEGAPLVVVTAGLGGGTGSGATPLVVKLARERGALVLALLTLPFTFEGRRRQQQARESLAAIQQYADAVICFDNDRMGEIALPTSGIHDAFARTDQLLGQCVRSLCELTQRRGLIRLGFDDLRSALRAHDARCLFGYGEATGELRASEALEQALRSPLMEGGVGLAQVAAVLVNVSGGPDLRLSEVEGLMKSLAGRVGDHTQILFGASVDGRMDGRLGVMIISALSANPAAMPAQPISGPVAVAPEPPPMMPAVPPPSVYPSAMPPPSIPAVAPLPRASSPTVRPASGAVPPAPELRPAASAGASFFGDRFAPRALAPPAAPEPPAPRPAGTDTTTAPRGRFDRSEPTIVDGEDLDVPVFMRKGLKK